MRGPLAIACLAMLAAGASSCAPPEVNPTPPRLVTHPPTHVRVTTVNLGGVVGDDGGAPVFNRGICWATHRNPTIGDHHITAGRGTGEFALEVEGLSPGTTYHARAFAENAAGIAYGNLVSFTTNAVVMDADGNPYHGITIGSQVWLQEDLRVSRYRTLDTILHLPDGPEWATTTQGAWSHYGNAQAPPFGKLYNWHAVNDPRGLCPTGWRVPTRGDWLTLMDYLGGEQVAGGQLKEWGLTHWQAPNAGADGTTLFMGLPSGFRSFTGGEFLLRGSFGYWWSSTLNPNDSAAWHVTLFHDQPIMGLSISNRNMGYSVRCIRE